jgi:hypothetical protein
LFSPSRYLPASSEDGVIYRSRLQRIVWYPAGTTSLAAVCVLLVASLVVIVLGRGGFDPSQPLDLVAGGTGGMVLILAFLCANLATLFLLARGDYLTRGACLRAVTVSLFLLTLGCMLLFAVLDAETRAAMLSWDQGLPARLLSVAMFAQGMIFGILALSGLVGASDGRVGRIGERMETVRGGLLAIGKGGAGVDQELIAGVKEDCAALIRALDDMRGFHVSQPGRLGCIRACLDRWSRLLADQPRYFVADGSWREDEALVKCLEGFGKRFRSSGKVGTGC